MQAYRGVFGNAFLERVIEKSRFLAYAVRTEDEEQAKAFLADLRAEHPLATHVCYGYIADDCGNLQRFSDDGEPQGTAGMPILGVLKAEKLCATAIAVVRYFGGIKLGAGGLTRAYAGAAAEVVRNAEIRSFEPCREIELTVGYPEVNAALHFLGDREILSRTFGETARFAVAVKEEEKAAFIAALSNALCGRVQVREGKAYRYPFPIA